MSLRLKLAQAVRHLLAIVAVSACLAQPSPVRGAGETDAIAAYLAPYVAQKDFSGVVYVEAEDRDVYRAEFGNVDSFDTSFSIGSISKTFTAAAVELLAARGSLRYGESLERLIPEYRYAKDVTIAQLLDHTAGIPDFYAIPGFASVRVQNLPLPDIVRWLSRYPLDFRPGSKNRYSNSGYILLALAIERASGESYAVFLRDNIFKPFELSHTTTDGDLHEARIAPGYDPGPPPNELVPAATIAPAWFTGNASIRSTSSDLAHWLDIAAAGKVVNSRSLPYPFGWGKRTFGHDTLLEQDGRIPGFASYISIDEQNGMKVVVLSNIQCAAASVIGQDLRKLASGDSVSPPQKRPVYTPSAAALAAVVGSYGVPGLTLTVSSKGEELYISNASDGMPLVLDPTGPNEFFFRPLYVSLRFVTDPTGEVRSIDWAGDFVIPRQPAHG